MTRPVNPTVPHSLDFAGAPWATRQARYRPPATARGYVPPELRGDLAGTPAYDAGAPHPESDLLLPKPYDWAGDTAVPNELYAMAVDLSSAFGNALGVLPQQTDVNGVANWLQGVYGALSQKGEGCGIEPRVIAQAIIANAPAGPHAVAYALQEAARTSDVCNKYLIKNPLTPPVMTRETPSTGTFVPNGGGKPKTTDGKPFPWGWTLAGASIAAVIAASIYYMSRGAKKRKNPCRCSNPAVAAVVVDEYDDGSFSERENPYSGKRGYSSIDPFVLDQATAVSPFLTRPNPKKRRKARR